MSIPSRTSVTSDALRVMKSAPVYVSRVKLASAGVVVALGGFAFDQVLRILQRSGADVPRPRPKFSHGVEVDLGSRTVLGCYHPSQQNTFTGRLTESMFDAVWERARRLISP